MLLDAMMRVPCFPLGILPLSVHDRQAKRGTKGGTFTNLCWTVDGCGLPPTLKAKARRMDGLLRSSKRLPESLEFLEEITGRAGDVDSAGDTALAVLDALDDACGLRALGAIGALLGVHDLLAVAGLGNLCHNFFS